MPDALLPTLERLLAALAVGFLIGLERERAEVRKRRALFAGIRTFPLIALAGAVPVLVRDVAGPALLVVSFAGVATIAAVSYVRTSAAGDAGATTEVAALTTFLLGALAGTGQVAAAGAAGVVVAILLNAKPRLERFSRALTAEEMIATLELAVITVIVLPVLPDRGFGPWQVLNPRDIWLVVVLVSAFSFAGFIAVRLLGPQRGLVVPGALGGLVSSTAVTLAMAARSRAGDTRARPAAAAAVIASTVMCLRVAVLAGAVNVRLLPALVPVVGAMALAGAAAAWRLGRPPGGAATSRPVLGNPFSLRAALTFGAGYALVLLSVRAAEVTFGSGGMYAAAALSGAVDVDAPTVAFARLAGAPAPAVGAITIALVANTLVKLGLAVGFGAGRFRHEVARALAVMAGAGLLVGAGVWLRG